ncbi:cadherin-like domain-containing protein [Anaerovorax odorimutans]|uniref:cadherin-like domain-containing protein n=1 Tax=Anaerovorax odorimutans TaxID=109327 RepID=UPI0006859ACE|nr:cadherin-like domain-containing protein [Anaerovorax odorimutans]
MKKRDIMSGLVAFFIILGLFAAIPINAFALSIDIDDLDVLATLTALANTDPTISIDNSSLSYTENEDATQIDANATASDADGDCDWDGGNLTIRITSNNKASDELSIPIVGSINTNGINLRDGTTVFGALNSSGGTVTNNTALTITFNSNATNALVQQTLRAISYRSTSENPSTSNRTITFTLTDGNSGSVSDTRTVEVSAVDDAPTIVTNDGLTLNEDARATIPLDLLKADDVDTDNATLTYTVTSSPSNGKLENTDNPGVAISSFTQKNLIDGKIQYVHDGSNTTSDSFTFKVSDGTNELIGQTFSITINAVDDDAPTMTTNNGLALNEGATAAIPLDILESDDEDTDNDILTYIITSSPLNGQLENTDNPGISINNFTQQNLIDGKIQYVHDGSNTTSDIFIFKVSDGTNELTGQVFRITVNPGVNSTISPITVNFDKNTSAQSDINITMTLNGNTLSNIKNGTDTLTSGKDYTVSGSTVIISKAYLANQLTGNVTLTFNFNIGDAQTLSIVVTDSTSSGSSSGGHSSSSSSGESQSVGTSSSFTNSKGQTVTTVNINTAKLDKVLETKTDRPIVTIPVISNSDIAIAELTGQMIKNMESKEAVLEVKTVSSTYTLPAAEINMESISEQLGESVNLSDIKVQIQIAEPSADAIKVVENAAKAGNFTIMVPAVEFNINCTYNGKLIDISKFNSYVERTIAIPVEVDLAKITSAVVIEPDGTVRSVPTKVIQVDGKYYAKISSLTNSIYTVIYNPIDFVDVENHWAKDSINNMGSKMIISGVGKGKYNPNSAITRAEFAAILVRALGLETTTGENQFIDLKSTNWFCDYVNTASEYGIINGESEGTFAPNDKITREQAMVMIARAMKITGIEPTVTESEISTLLAEYTDAQGTSSYAKADVASCLQTGVISGTSSSTLAPKNNITRAEVAVIVERLLKKSELI